MPGGAGDGGGKGAAAGAAGGDRAAAAAAAIAAGAPEGKGGRDGEGGRGVPRPPATLPRLPWREELSQVHAPAWLAGLMFALHPVHTEVGRHWGPGWGMAGWGRMGVGGAF
jgi:hypothetical protein